jgi:hypothetical protein
MDDGTSHEREPAVVLALVKIVWTNMDESYTSSLTDGPGAPAYVQETG